MEYRRLGRTDISVSVICLGTMSYGNQNTEAEGHQHMDYCLERGVNFFDTAEMYAVPPTAETYGKSEEVLGTWLASRKNRDKAIIATKAVGPGERFRHIRDGNCKFNREHLVQAVEDSLRRLQTDYIDLYQLHWPERTVNSFGSLLYPHVDDEDWTPIEETLSVLSDLIDAGKIRAIGLSNETAWGTMAFLRAAERDGLPRVASVQNIYNFLNRAYEVGLSEVSIREDVGLLAYSPIAGGVLSGKYLNGAVPKNSRMDLFKGNFSRHSSDLATRATEAYVKVADKHGLVPVQMANAFVNSRRFLTSNIIGATSMEQLKTNIDTAEMTLAPEVIEDIEATHRLFPIPCS